MTAIGDHPQTSPAERVWSRLPATARAALEDGLSPTDLQTLLLDLSRTRARRVTPARLGQRWRQDRFAQPSPVDPRRLASTELQLWELLPPQFAGLALSPVAPLGSCSSLAPVDQNRVLSTVRSSEVVSDPTNVLALEAATRRRAGEAEVHLAAHHRVLRNQAFDDPGALAHFSLFTLVSSARDRGAARTEALLLTLHLQFWSDVTAQLVPAADPRIQLTVIDDGAVRDRVGDTVRRGVSGCRIEEAPSRTQGIGYYHSAAFKVVAGAAPGSELGDGGFTDWTAALLSDAKERCLISCISTERLTQLHDTERDDSVG